MNAIAYTRAYISGMKRGYRISGRSLLRRMLVTILLSALLLAVSFALLWEAADVFSRLTTGEAASVRTFNLFEVWNRVNGRTP